MLGRKRQRLSKPKLESGVKACLRRAAFALVRHEHERLARGPHELRDPGVGGGGAGPRVDHEHDEIGFGDGLRGLLRHPCSDAAGLGILKTGGVGQDDRVPADADARFLAVAGEAGHVVDKRKPLAGEPVEQGRFADIGAANDGNSVGHRSKI